MRWLAACLLAMAVLAAVPVPARAASDCYDAREFPSIRALEPLGGGFRAYLDPGSVSSPPRVATLPYSKARGCHKGEDRKPPASSRWEAHESRSASIPAGYELALEQARALSPTIQEAGFPFVIEQKITACTEREGIS